MFNITPIGSCRITGPLRDGQAAHGIRLNQNRCYGYCHSPAEAVQLARFMVGDVSIPDHIWPLVSRSAISKAAYEAQAKSDSDLYVVELSSAKELTLDGVSIQLNYLRATFEEFFSDTKRAQEFWALAEDEDKDPVHRFLEKTWSQTDAQKAEAATLARIQLRIADRESLRNDISTLANLLPEILFVSHVNAAKTDGQLIGSRSKFISLVNQEAGRSGFPVFNPTDLMSEFGQPHAIEDHSTSLAHFTSSFGAAIVDDWMQNVVAPLTDAAVQKGMDSAVDQFQQQIQANWNHGRHASTLTRLNRVSGIGEEFAEAQNSAIQVAQAAGADFLTKMERYADGLEAMPELSVVFMEAVHLGQFDSALELAGLPDEGPIDLSDYHLMRAARQAMASGEWATAFEFAYAVSSRNSAAYTAHQMIGTLITSHAIAAFDRLTDTEIRNLVNSVPAKARLGVLGLQNLDVGFAVSADTEIMDLASLVSELANAGKLSDAIDLMVSWREATRTESIRHPEVVALLDEWVSAAQALPEVENRIEALVAILDADPRHKGVRHAIQAQKVDFMNRVRVAGKAGELDALEAMRTEARHFPGPLPEFHLWRARLRFSEGEFEHALKIGLMAARDLPETIQVWVLLMRSALKLDRIQEACEYAANVLALATAATINFRDEAKSILDSHMVEC